MTANLAFVLFCFVLTGFATVVPILITDRRRRIAARRVRIVRRARFDGAPR